MAFLVVGFRSSPKIGKRSGRNLPKIHKRHPFSAPSTYAIPHHDAPVHRWNFRGPDSLQDPNATSRGGPGWAKEKTRS